MAEGGEKEDGEESEKERKDRESGEAEEEVGEKEDGEQKLGRVMDLPRVKYWEDRRVTIFISGEKGFI